MSQEPHRGYAAGMKKKRASGSTPVSKGLWKYDEKFDQATKIKFDQELDDRTSVDNIYKLIVALIVFGLIMYVAVVGPGFRADEVNHP